MEQRIKKPKCRCYINAKYKSKTAWRTGRLPRPCPVPGHDEDLKQTTYGEKGGERDESDVKGDHT